MKSKTIIIIIFIIVCLIQLFIPLKMILNREDILETGKEYKFKVEPVDPSDPFRGRYITLQFSERRFVHYAIENRDYSDQIYVKIKNDISGFARIDTLVYDRPADSGNYFKAKISAVSYSGDSIICSLRFPFDRFYMEESKAPLAEKLYHSALSDTSQLVWALVSIKDGSAVLKDVYVRERPIKDIVADSLYKDKNSLK